MRIKIALWILVLLARWLQLHPNWLWEPYPHDDD